MAAAEYKTNLVENDQIKATANLLLAIIPMVLGIGFVTPVVAVFMQTLPVGFHVEEWKLAVLQFGCWGLSVILYGSAMKHLEGLKP